MPRRERTALPATVSLSMELGGACVSAESVPWADAERVLCALVTLMEAVRARTPSLRTMVDTVPGGTPVEVGEYDLPGTRRVGF